VIILPDTGAHEAVQVADRIRTKIENHKFTGGRRLQIRLTASIGLAVFPDDAFSPHQLIACADTAMYAAKAANKNCVRVAKSADSALNATRVTQESLDAVQFQRIPDQKFIS
jgi:diguanylate cyclase (GGDEF)-like protein